MNPLDNVMWHALTGAQACFATGSGAVRRFAPGFSALLGFEDPSRPDFRALEAICEPGERFYAAGWSGEAPAGWRIEEEAALHLMVWDGTPLPPGDGAAPLRLDTSHVPQMIELTTLTRPGPFGPRTIELGEYWGDLDADGRLRAMAGERLWAGPYREVSGVCTHPDAQGGGHARRLMLHVMRRQIARDQQPFLHVMGHNAGAIALYRKLGFKLRTEQVVRVLTREALS